MALTLQRIEAGAQVMANARKWPCSNKAGKRCRSILSVNNRLRGSLFKSDLARKRFCVINQPSESKEIQRAPERIMPNTSER
jgi:hypothetical protein